MRLPAPITPMNVRNLSRCCLLLLDGIFMVSKIFEFFRCFVKFDGSGHAKFFTFSTLRSKINGFWKVCRFGFLVKFDWSGPAIIFGFWTITKHLNYLSRLFPINQRQYQDLIKMVNISYSWKDYGWFLIGLLIFDFSWSFTGPYMQ